MMSKRFKFIMGPAVMSVLCFNLVAETSGNNSPDDSICYVTDSHNCVVAINPDIPVIRLIFSADSMFEGADTALVALADANIKGSFFFTGNFLRRPENEGIVRRIVEEGHYVGPHSDRHILLADWDAARTPLVSDDSLSMDILRNYEELKKFGITSENSPVILPPFEWCSSSQANAYRRLGLLPIAPYPAVETYRDYTTPDMKEYRSSEYMEKQLFDYEKTHGLNGAVLIFHLGTQDVRTDKLYYRLPRIIKRLKTLGYSFERF